MASTVTSDETGVAGFDAVGLLRRARRLADLSQRDLAGRADVAASTAARAELAPERLSLATVMRLFAAAGMHLVVQDRQGRELEPMRDDGIRDRRGHRYAAHLDPEPMERAGHTYPPLSRGARPDPVAAQERREHRDERRAREGVPADHPGPESLAPRWFRVWLQRRRERERAGPPPAVECLCEPVCVRACVPECRCQCEPSRDRDGPDGDRLSAA